MKDLSHQALDFFRSKPADERYRYSDHRECAMCQFLQAAGYSNDPRVGPCFWNDGPLGEIHEFAPALEDALVQWPHTFSALASRLSAAIEGGEK